MVLIKIRERLLRIRDIPLTGLWVLFQKNGGCAIFAFEVFRVAELCLKKVDD